MTRAELLQVAKPILFNTDMVRAILDGRKTVTRRCVKYKYSNTEMKMRTDKYGTRLIEIQKDIEGETHGKNPDGTTWHKLLGYIEPKPPYKKGNYLYVRETWQECCRNTIHSPLIHDKYCFKASLDSSLYGCIEECGQICKWRPSIHMPKEVARIFLRVTDVRVERLRDITDEQAIKEGFEGEPCSCVNGEYIFGRYSCTDCMGTGWIESPWVGFMETWNSTIKKSDLDRYGWDANPWVFVIAFERIGKDEVLQQMS